MGDWGVELLICLVREGLISDSEGWIELNWDERHNVDGYIVDLFSIERENPK